MAKIRCKVNYHRKSNSLLATFALGVKAGIFEHNPPFIASPMTEPIFLSLIEAFSEKYALYKEHKASKEELDGVKKPLMEALDDFSNYINRVADGDATIIGLAGFEPTKGNTSNVNAPAQPTGVTLERGLQGELLADCNPVEKAETYGALLVADNPIPEGVYINEVGQIVISNGVKPEPTPTDPTPGPSSTPSGILGIADLTKTRRKKFIALTVGVTYYVYYWASNAGGVSPLSESVRKKVVE